MFFGFGDDSRLQVNIQPFLHYSLIAGAETAVLPSYCGEPDYH